jgi:superfamily II RNA helicase
MRYKDYDLYPFQEEAIQAIEAGRSVIVSAPTGAGKTLIAEYAVESGIARKKRIVYTSPIKALSNQKYRDFQKTYGDRIGIMTGDVTINGDAPVLIMTTEIFRNTIFTDPHRLQHISHVILDEVHYISDLDRGTVWEESIIFAPEGIRFVGLSATISNLEQFRDWISEVRHEPVDLVETRDRPVPLRHEIFIPEIGPARISEFKKLLPRAKTLHHNKKNRNRVSPYRFLQSEKLLPALFFCFSRREVEGRARNTRGLKLLDGRERQAILSEYDRLIEKFQIGEHSGSSELRDMASKGIMYHHAGLLPVYKEIVERLFTTGLVKLLFTTETFALGVNMPARTVVFSSLRKYNGINFDYLSTLGYYQMAGRAGRQGLDEEGSVFSLVNVEFDAPKEVTKVIFGKVEALVSRFNLNYSAILNLHELLGEDIYSAVDRSFAAYQRGGNPKKEREKLASRLKILDRFGYLNGPKLTGKGRIAARMNGYEIQLTELYWSGCFESLTAEECAILVMGIVFEPRKGEYERIMMQGMGSVRNRARKRISEFRKMERKLGLANTLKPLDWGLSAAVRAWTQGAPFWDLRDFTTSRDGDLVRSFRMGVQLLRQFAQAVPGDEELTDRLWEAFALLNRDEVDAEAQIRLGSD